MMMRTLASLSPKSYRGVYRAVLLLWTELRIARRHAWSIVGIHRVLRGYARPYRLHVGSGSQTKAGWLNLDLHPAADLRLDLRAPLPIPDESVRIVYSEHFLEHLDPPDARRFLAEALRVLEPGGVMSISVPNGAPVLAEYVTGEHDLLDHAREVGWHPGSLTTPMDQVNYLFRQGREHRYIYDAETLAGALAEAGFVDARERPFDETLDSPARRRGSLLMAARKPR